MTEPKEVSYKATVDQYLSRKLRYYAKDHKRNLGIIYFRANNDSLDDEIFVPACLPKQPVPSPEANCYISGIDSSSKDAISTTPMKILSKDDCRKLTSTEDYERHEKLDIVQWDICATNSNGDCPQFLEAGSPLICNENGKAVVYGVASLLLEGNQF